jgi:hypothetical protein
VDKNNAYRTTTTRVSAEEIEKLEEVKWDYLYLIPN